MKPLNRSERNSAFLRFFLLFAMTVALIVVVVFLSIEVPFRENDRLREKLAAQKTEGKELEDFARVMKEAVSELKKFDERSEPPQGTYQRVQTKINEMSQLLKGIPNSANSLNELMVVNLSELNMAKYKLNTRVQ